MKISLACQTNIFVNLVLLVQIFEAMSGTVDFTLKCKVSVTEIMEMDRKGCAGEERKRELRPLHQMLRLKISLKKDSYVVTCLKID